MIINILRCLLTVLLEVILIFASAEAKDASYKSQPLNVPGATSFIPFGINDYDDVVGYAYFNDGEQGIHYNMTTGQLEKIKYPGACFTNVTGINNNLQIVGNYNTGCEPGSDPTPHAFFRDWDGTFHNIDLPAGASPSFTQMGGVNFWGDVTGAHVVAGVHRGFIRRCAKNIRGVFTCGAPSYFDPPAGMFLDSVGDITNRGETAGELWDGHQVGFRRDNQGRYTIFDYPDPQVVSTSVQGANKKLVAGWYFTDNGTGIGTWHSFVSDGVNYQNIDPLSLGDVKYSLAMDINEKGIVVGYFAHSDGIAQGFVAFPK